MRKLFGTDGIRGVAGEYPLNAATIFTIGFALGSYFKQQEASAKIVIGQDTRESSQSIGDTLAAGLAAAHCEVISAGVITTPGVAYLARAHGYSAGIVISASHNPWRDNGIKIFAGDGYKLPDEIEMAIEAEIFRLLGSGSLEVPASFPRRRQDPDLRRDYERWLIGVVDASAFSGLRAVIDCANGAASPVAHELFSGLGLRVEITHAAPNGRNINENCGALYPAVVAAEVQRSSADIGITFDGDADRALFSDENGNVVNGDAVMLLLARDLASKSMLTKATVVATTMSNMGLEAALKRSGIHMLRAPVGDKYVLEAMRSSGAVLGGEQSGHIILSRIATTGDGMLTALRVLEVLGGSGKKLSGLVSDLKVFPQVIKNVHVREKKPLESLERVRRAIQSAEAELKDTGRVVIRYSGTEALARVMIEAESRERMQFHADAIAMAIERELGTGAATHG